MTKRKAPEDKIKTGRPSTYTVELADLICHSIATTDCGTKRLCDENAHFPNFSTIYEWMYKYPEFSAKYKAAKMHQAEILAESINQISQEKWTYFDEHGNEKMDAAFIADKRIRMDARKWLASKLIPKVYGDKTQNETVVTIRHEDALRELD